MAIELRLTAELVPKTSWGNNMRSAFPEATWDSIRKGIYAEYSYHCGICRAGGQLDCHEIWEYDDQTHIQTLRGFIALCEWCHHVKHIGLAGVRARQGKLDFERVIGHFMRVNECDRLVFEDHHCQAREQWRERSQHPWRVNLGEYESMVTREQSAY